MDTPTPKNHATAAHAAAHTPDDKASKNEEEKKQNPGGLKMHNEPRRDATIQTRRGVIL